MKIGKIKKKYDICDKKQHTATLAIGSNKIAGSGIAM